MPRRRALTEAQLENLLALPTTEAELARYWTLGDEDLAIIGRRRRAHNRLGFALQLCALRYPGRVLCAGEVLSDAALSFVAEQIGTEPDVLAGYGARVQTRYQQLDALRAQFGFGDLAPVRQEILGWLLPVALTTTSAASIAEALCEELRAKSCAAGA
jgi:TnpA family transposase